MTHTLRIVVDNRLRFPSDTPLELITRLKAETTYKNPDYAKAKALGLFRGNISPQVHTWKEEDGAYSMPRGCSQRVRDAASSCGIEVRFVDERATAPIRWKPFRIEPRPYQRQAMSACLKKQQGLVRAPTGCIYGDAEIGVNRAGKSFKIRLADLVYKHKGGATDAGRASRKWDPAIPTTVRSRGADGFVRLTPLLDAYESGEKFTYRVQTASGHALRATAEHLFLTDEGWKELRYLEPGSLVWVEGQRGLGERGQKPWYRLVSGVRFHPYAGRLGVNPAKGGVSVPMHRLIVEADMNGVEYEEYVTVLRRDEKAAFRYVFLDPVEWAVHHVDRNPLNNALANLYLCTHEEHRQIHAADSAKHVAISTALSEIVEIAEHGTEPTYDLALEEPHNYLADGMVVHNSGKTFMALASLPLIGQRALVIMRDQNLMKQWIDRAGDGLGLSAKDIGICGAGKRKVGTHLTLALQQTLYSEKFPLSEFAKMFGAVIVDEVQDAAARTVNQTVDAFPAQVRLGFSADHTRRDRKEFLIEDQFGSVIYEVDKKSLESIGAVVPVVVRLVPTDFKADWYSQAGPDERDFVRLVTEMSSDEERCQLVRCVVLELVQAGTVPALVFTNRREHAMRLADEELPADGVRSGLLLGSQENAAQFEESKALLLSGVLKVAVGTYKAVGQGIDIPNVMSGVCATPIGENRQYFNQVRGRICRVAPGKTVGHLYYLWDRYVFPDAAKNLLGWNDGLVEVFDRQRKGWVTFS